MENTLYVALSNQMALRRMLDVTANNVANMNTVAFRAERPVFADYVERAKGAVAGGQSVAFVIDRATYTDIRDGALTRTDNPFDVAIQGDGWLTVETPDGPRHTRDGRLMRDDLGRLVTLAGNPVLAEGGAEIQIPEDAAGIVIRSDGMVTLSSPVEGGETEELGRLELVRLAGAEGLEREPGGLVRAKGDPEPAEGVRVVQGMLERANVEPIAEITRLVELTRAYAQSNRIVEAEHERQRNAVAKLGGSPNA